MVSHDRQEFEDSEPGIAFQAGFGFHLGLIATGLVAIGGVLADVGTGTLLGLLPSTLTFVAIAGHIGVKRARGLPERIGRSLRRRLRSYLPSAAFAAVPIGLSLVPTPLESTARLGFVAALFALLTAVSAYGVNRTSRKRYVEAITGNEPVARWTWYRSSHLFGEKLMLGASVFLVVSGLFMLIAGSVFGLFWAAYGAFLLGSRRFDWGDWADPGERWNPPELCAYDAGVVVNDRKLVPWDEICDIRLTDDELVLERDGLHRDIRCDRSSLENPEGLLEDIERARSGRHTRADNSDARGRDEQLEGEPSGTLTDAVEAEAETELEST